jgi:hypothetical protein
VAVDSDQWRPAPISGGLRRAVWILTSWPISPTPTSQLRHRRSSKPSSTTRRDGQPDQRRAWLANKLHEFGVTPQAGHVILSGSFIRAIPFQAGDTVEALFNELGEVSFRAA